MLCDNQNINGLIMEKQDFLKLQFETLRKEIEATKDRIFKLVGFGVITVPAAHFFSQVYKLDVVLISIPILVIVISLLYLSENHDLMRCGRYIRLHIEPEIKDFIGWENWLEKVDEFEKRSVDKFVSYCFYILFSVYFIGSIYIATKFVLKTYGIIPCAGLLGTYIAIGIWFFLYLIKNIRNTTTTKTER